MNSLYNKNYVAKIRKKYRKNIKNKYGIVGENLQRCHIFGIREAKYLEIVLNLDNINTLVEVLTWSENTLLLTSSEHRLFEQNKLTIQNDLLSEQQQTLKECAQLIKSTKFRTSNYDLALVVYDKLNKMKWYN